MSHFLLLLFVLLFSRIPTGYSTVITSQYSQKAEVSKISSFLNSLIHQGFPDTCKLIFISNSKSQGTIEIRDFTLLMQRISSSYFHFVYSHESFSLSTSYPNATHYPHLITNHFRHSGQCFIVILLISELDPVFLRNTKEFLSPVYIPLVRKNEAYFIFITKSYLIDSLLLSHEYPRKIKFKIALAYSNESSSLQIKTHCFYCNSFAGSNSTITFEDTGNGSLLRNYYYPDFTKNLNGHLLRISVPLLKSRLEFNTSVSKDNALRGVCKYLFDDFLRPKINFSYYMFLSSAHGIEHPAGGTGVKLGSNGGWTGVVGDILSGQADVGLIADRTTKRIHVIENTDAFYESGSLTFVTGKGSEVIRSASLFWSFDFISWILMFTFSLLSFLILKILLCFARLKTRNQTVAFQSRNRSVWLFIIGTCLGQDCPSFPQVWSVRIFTYTWILFVAIMSTAYRSKQFEFMTITTFEDTPETFEQLVFLYRDYEKGFIKEGDAVYNTLNRSTDRVYSKLVGEMSIHYNHNGTGLDCIKLALQKKYACIGYDFTLNFLQQRFLEDTDIARLKTATDSTYNDWEELSFEGQSILKETFERQLRLVMPMHFHEIWDDIDIRKSVNAAKVGDRKTKHQGPKKNKQRSSMPTQTSINAEGIDAKALNVHEFSGAGMIGVFGSALSLSVFIMELLSSRLTSQKHIVKIMKPKRPNDSCSFKFLT